MKTFVVTMLALCLSMGQIFAQPGELTSPNDAMSTNATFQWLTPTTHDFGKIKQGTPVTINYEFINSGKAPIVITSVETSCGCTAADYSKAPVLPGKKGYIKSTYDAAKIGVFDKTITIHSNVVGNDAKLFLKGEVTQ